MIRNMWQESKPTEDGAVCQPYDSPSLAPMATHAPQPQRLGNRANQITVASSLDEVDSLYSWGRGYYGDAPHSLVQKFC